MLRGGIEGAELLMTSGCIKAEYAVDTEALHHGLDYDNLVLYGYSILLLPLWE